MTTQAALWTLAGALILLAGLAAFAEHRRSRRGDLDKPGFMPWALLQVLAGIAAVVAAALAVKL